MESLRRRFSGEHNPYGIRVVTLKTGGVPETIPENIPARNAIRESIEQARLLQRAATQEDAGNGFAFLAPDKPGTVTSADLNLSCGSIVD